MFDELLKTIFNVNESENESVNVNENENESVSENESENENENENEIKKYNIFEQDKHSQYVIQPAHKRDDLLDTIEFIQQFNKIIQPYLT